MWPAGLEPAPRRVSGDRSTVAELRPRVSGRGWTPQLSSLLFVNTSACAIEPLARWRHRELRDKDSNLYLRVQSAALPWPLDDPGKKRSVVHATRLRSTLDRCGVTAAARHRGGVLEPGAPRPLRNTQAKAAVVFADVDCRVPADKDLSLWAGPRCRSRFLAHLVSHLFSVGLTSKTTKATLSGSPSLRGRTASVADRAQGGTGRQLPGARRSAISVMKPP